MQSEDAEYRFSQIHIDAARNATDDFNPFHDPYKWKAIKENPFGSTIVLGFQLEALIEYRLSLHRAASGESKLVSQNGLNFSNYQFSFADIVRPGESIRVDIKTSAKSISPALQLSNRIVVRKNKSPVVVGRVLETKVPVVSPDSNFDGMGNMRKLNDRSFIENGRYFLKRKFMNTSNAKNFLAGSLVDQHHYFDELEDRVQFSGIFPVSLLSCALLEKAKLEEYDFFKDPMVYVSHSISVDLPSLDRLKSNDFLHILVEELQHPRNTKGLGETDIPQTIYRCFGLLDNNKILFRARVSMARLKDIVATKAKKQSMAAQ